MKPIKAVAIERVSSIDYLTHIFDCHASNQIALPVAVGASTEIPGIKIDARKATRAGGGWFTQSIRPRHDSTPAQITLTSGSTGAQKAILLSHRALGDVSTRLVDFMQLDDTVREYVGVPVTYVFGFGRVRAIAAVGGASYLPEHGFRVDEVAAMLGGGEINALSAAPTLLRVLLDQRARFDGIGERLRWLEIGSQAMTRAEKEAVRSVFPNARILQNYGLTEASRTTFLDVSNMSGDALDSVGAPIGAVELKIDDESQILIRGPNVADGLITAEGVVPLTDADGWFKTKDLGHLNNGMLVFDGRADDLINVSGVKVPSEAFEVRLRNLVGSKLAFAVAPGTDPLRGQVVVVTYEESAKPKAVEQLREAAQKVSKDMNVADSVALFAIDAIPRTDTNKVRRKEIGMRFDAARAAPSRVAEAAIDAPDNAYDNVAGIFLSKFGAPARNANASFRSLEGDSLSYIDVMLRLERLIPNLPKDWDSRSIDELSALARLSAAPAIAESPKPAQSNRPDSYRPGNLDTVRGLACVLIVALHVLGAKESQGLHIPRPNFWHGVMDAFMVVRLPLFTAIAGYIYGAMPAARDGFFAFMGAKLKQLAAPLIFATAVFWTLERLVIHENERSLLLSYLYGYEHLWYIYAILIMFAFVGLIDKLFAPPAPVWLVLIVAIMAAYQFVPYHPATYLRQAVLYLPFFLFGIVIQRNSAWMKQWVVTPIALVLLVSVIALIPLGQPEAVIADKPALLIWLGGFGAVVLALLYCPRLIALEALAAFSFTIYLWHPAASAAMRTLLWRQGVDSLPLLFIAGLIAGVAVPVLMYLVCQRLPKFISIPVIGR